MILVDTSSWIHWIRPNGDRVVKQRVIALLQNGAACWCPVIRLELWNGAGGDQEKKILRELEHRLPVLPIDDAVWDAACALAHKARTAGVTVPATDVLIAACAQRHGVELESADTDFDRLAAIAG